MSNKPFYMVVIWWVSWHVVNQLRIVDIDPATGLSNYLFITMYVSMILGYFSISLATKKKPLVGEIIVNNKSVQPSDREDYFLLACLFFCFVILFFSLYRSGALTSGFYDYFLKIRGVDAHGLVTGSSFLDNIIKIFVVPIIISCVLYEFSFSQRYNVFRRSRLTSCFVNMLLFTYLFQVNYLLVLTFVILIFFVVDSSYKFGSSVFRNKRLLSLVLIVFGIIVFAASNRYGSFDILGILLYYPATYFSLSFSLFDFNLIEGNDSILNDHTYGMSLLGYIGVIPFMFFKHFLPDFFYFIPSALENIGFNSRCVNLGGDKCYNAFGSVLFSLYRDFSVFGPIIGGIIYGASLSYLNIKRKCSEIYNMYYYYLLSMGIISIMVSPFDLPYFWFVFVVLAIFKSNFKKRVIS